MYLTPGLRVLPLDKKPFSEHDFYVNVYFFSLWDNFLGFSFYLLCEMEEIITRESLLRASAESYHQEDSMISDYYESSL